MRSAQIHFVMREKEDGSGAMMRRPNAAIESHAGAVWRFSLFVAVHHMWC
jgi:hypothetical protein